MNRKRQLLYFFTVILVGVIIILRLDNSKSTLKSTTKSGFFFDTYISITIYDSKESYCDYCLKMCKDYEDKFSATKENSEIYQINENSKAGEFTTVSKDTIELINYGINYSNESDMNFDITIGALSKLWNVTDSTMLPSDKAIENAKSTIDFNNIVIEDNRVKLKNPNSSIDLGGLAKGYIADQLKEYLLSKNVKRGIINLGGNVLLIGNKPDKSNYNIGIQYPFMPDGETIAVFRGKDISVVTSGIYERYFKYDDKIYHHILDINTGYPTDNSILSVTIITKSSLTADAYSTMVFNKGLEAGMDFINTKANIECIIIDKDYNIHLSNGLKKDGDIITLR